MAAIRWICGAVVRVVLGRPSTHTQTIQCLAEFTKQVEYTLNVGLLSFVRKNERLDMLITLRLRNHRLKLLVALDSTLMEALQVR